ncbi:hypothetical protein L210DRAFT_3585228, partial [Boletus edulis BED1]
MTPNVSVMMMPLHLIGKIQGMSKSWSPETTRYVVYSVFILILHAFGQFPSTTTSLIQRCSRFRLLIIGNSGVGKSSLLHEVFGVEGVRASDTNRGISDIDQEFVSPTNARFVVHDSLGFESGDEGNM